MQPEAEDAPAHDAIIRLIHRLFPSTERLWQEAKEQVDLTTGILIADDSTLDKWYSRNIELVTRHWSGKHKRVVSGINLVTLLWTDGERSIPAGFTLDGGPHPELSHEVTPGVDFEFIPNGMTPYNSE